MLGYNVHTLEVNLNNISSHQSKTISNKKSFFPKSISLKVFSYKTTTGGKSAPELKTIKPPISDPIIRIPLQKI